MKKILLVEDSKSSGMAYKRKIEVETKFEVDWVETMADAIQILDGNGENYLLAVLDFNLPDSTQGEIIDEVTGRGVPSIVFTSMIDEEIRKLVWSKKVVDYVPKENPRSIDEVISLIKRLNTNDAVTILIVDDATLSRAVLTTLLHVHRYKTIEAEDGNEALKALEEHPEITLIIIDAMMDGMDGFELTEKIRETSSKDGVAIIGISCQGKDIFGAKFLKAGASDFLIKQTFLTEEFYCRINQCIESIQNINKLKEGAIKDFLTGLHNRRYFFDAGTKLLANSNRTGSPLCCGMIDIDYFKKINDNYGHDVGDHVLQFVATKLKTTFRETDIVSRFGGEEFCILSVNIAPNDAQNIFETLRKYFESTEIELQDGQKLKITMSIGIFSGIRDDLDEIVKEADILLYEAKETGRNKIMIKQGIEP